MPSLNFEPIENKIVFVEIKKLIFLGEKLGVDLSRGLKELRKAISVAEQVAESKLVDEYLLKAKKEFDKALGDTLLSKFYDVDKEMKEGKFTSKDIEYCMNAAFSAIGVKHFEMALKNLDECRAELNKLKNPPKAVEVPPTIPAPEPAHATAAEPAAKAEPTPATEGAHKFEKCKATELVKCNICMGKVKPGQPMIKCSCGKTYHEPCAIRVGKCACGVEFK